MDSIESIRGEREIRALLSRSGAKGGSWGWDFAGRVGGIVTFVTSFVVVEGQGF